MTYDIENLMDDIETFMKANINTKIAAINAEKADSTVLKTISDSAYFFQSLDERVTNFNPFVFYGLAANIESEGIGPAVSKILPINIAVITFDSNQANIGKRYLRYNRAIEEIFLEKWDQVSNNATKVKVRTPVLIDFTILNDSQPFRVVGVELEVTVA